MKEELTKEPSILYSQDLSAVYRWMPTRFWLGYLLEYVHIEDKMNWVYNIVVCHKHVGCDDRKCVGTEIKLCPVARFRTDLFDEPSGFLTTSGERW
jgi:hypothetical protein